VDSSNEIVLGSSIRVFLLIVNRLLREALCRLFRKRSEILLVGQAEQTHATTCQILDSKCNVLVIDSCEVNWLAESFAMQSRGQTAPKAILIGMESDEKRFMAAVRAGVTGYLLKDASAQDVVAAVRAVSRGEAVCPPPLCSSLFCFVVQMARGMPIQGVTSRPDLTLRQQQLVSLVAKGLTNKEIASCLNLSEFTVRNHIHRILKQVHAENRRDAVDLVRAGGFLPHF
jgi:DNA-binding NarL/FixJ family response regulator